jgi:hypothetical protein
VRPYAGTKQDSNKENITCINICFRLMKIFNMKQKQIQLVTQCYKLETCDGQETDELTIYSRLLHNSLL